MKNEVKEILEYIDQFVYTDQTYNDIKLSKIDAKLISDYINNLQEKYEKAIEYNNKNIHSRTLDNILRGSDENEEK